MSKTRWRGAVVAVAVSVLAAVGCGKDEGQPPAAKTTAVDKTPVASAAKHHDHSGWWCDEHGVPEEVCGQCSAKAAAAFKKKGDWCKEHDRPDSQCFICHPELKEKFAAQYRAKYGKEPPPTEDEASAKGAKK